MLNGTATLIKNNRMAEVTNISPHGIWLMAGGKEYFIDYRDYPVFADASVRQIADVKADAFGNLHWKELDADIELDALKNPEKYPLAYTQEASS